MKVRERRIWPKGVMGGRESRWSTHKSASWMEMSDRAMGRRADGDIAPVETSASRRDDRE